MFFDGRIQMTYLAVATTGGLAGLSAGLGVPAGFTASDLTSYEACPVAPPTITAAVSRKSHATAGTFDLDLQSGTAVEARTGGPTQLLVTFDKPIQALGGASPDDVLLSSGTVTGVHVADNTLEIDLNGTANASALTVWFPGIADASAPAAVVTDTVCVGVLYGDANGDGAVNIFDLRDVRLTLDQPVAAGNSLMDVNADGLLNIFDLRDIRLVLDTALTSTCP